MAQRIAAALVLALLVACGSGPREVSVSHAWILLPPKGSQSMAGYADIANTTGKPVSIVSVSSDAFERVELHRTIVKNGQATMRPVDSLTLPDGGSARLTPGGMHLMLMRPTGVLKAGDRVRVTFRLAGGESLRGDFLVGETQPDWQ